MSADANNPAGALDALANYYFKKIEYIDAAESEALPERNLEPLACEALTACLRPRGVITAFNAVDGAFEDGFAFGMSVAATLTKHPLDAEAAIRRLLDELVKTIQWRREDEAKYGGDGCRAFASEERAALLDRVRAEVTP